MKYETSVRFQKWNEMLNEYEQAVSMVLNLKTCILYHLCVLLRCLPKKTRRLLALWEIRSLSRTSAWINTLVRWHHSGLILFYVDGQLIWNGDMFLLLHRQTWYNFVVKTSIRRQDALGWEGWIQGEFIDGKCIYILFETLLTPNLDVGDNSRLLKWQCAVALREV